MKYDVVSSLDDVVPKTEEGVESKVEDGTLLIQADQLNNITSTDKSNITYSKLQCSVRVVHV